MLIGEGLLRRHGFRRGRRVPARLPGAGSGASARPKSADHLFDAVVVDFKVILRKTGNWITLLVERNRLTFTSTSRALMRRR